MPQIVMAVLVRDDEVLLCHRTAEREWYPNVWDLPGGHVEDIEELDDALQRELEEELGITVAELPEPMLGVSFYDVEGTVWALPRWNGEVENRAPQEHDDLRWFRIDHLGDLDLAAPQIV